MQWSWQYGKFLPTSINKYLLWCCFGTIIWNFRSPTCILLEIYILEHISSVYCGNHFLKLSFSYMHFTGDLHSWTRFFGLLYIYSNPICNSLHRYNYYLSEQRADWSEQREHWVDVLFSMPKSNWLICSAKLSPRALFGSNLPWWCSLQISESALCGHYSQQSGGPIKNRHLILMSFQMEGCSKRA